MEHKEFIKTSPFTVFLATIYHRICFLFGFSLLGVLILYILEINPLASYGFPIPTVQEGTYVSNFICSKFIECNNTQQIIVWNICMWLIFAIQHSIMARKFFKQFLLRMNKKYVMFERSTFLLFSGLCCFAITYMIVPDNKILWSPPNQAVKCTGHTIALVAILYFVVAHWEMRFCDLWGFFITRQFKEDGVNYPLEFDIRPPTNFGRMQRHPIYTAFYLIFTGTSLYNTITITRATWVICAYIFVGVGTLLEERDLRKYPDYQQFIKVVPNMLIPDLFAYFRTPSPKKVD